MGMYDYMLQGLYLKGSLKNVEGGFQFALRNNIESGSISGIKKLEVDGTAVDLEAVMVGRDEPTRKAAELSYKSPLYLAYGQTCVIKVEGKTLAPGQHKLALTADSPEAGRATITIQDTI